MVEHMSSSRKRSRCLSIEHIDEEELSAEDETIPVILFGEDQDEDDAIPKVPKGFLCPLTLETMFDPVLDAEGNTYERYAILEWLKEHRTSPISRQYLSERMLKPNNSLREAIHEFMGPTWVQDMTAEHKRTTTTKHTPLRKRRGISIAPLDSHSREKIECFLQFTTQKIGGLELSLNSQGCCAFQYHGITVVLDVPVKAGVFCLYTRNLITDLTDAMKDLLLELNFLQGDTRGGCLSVKKHDDGRAEVIFSYMDRVAELCAQDFLNIILNFVETSMSLRRKLLATTAQTATNVVAKTAAPTTAACHDNSTKSAENSSPPLKKICKSPTGQMEV